MYEKVSCIRRLYRFLPVEKIGIYLTHQFRSLFSVSFKGVTDHSRLLNLPCLVCDHKLFFGNNWILFIKSLPNFTIENMRIIFKLQKGELLEPPNSGGFEWFISQEVLYIDIIVLKVWMTSNLSRGIQSILLQGMLLMMVYDIKICTGWAYSQNKTKQAGKKHLTPFMYLYEI